MGRSRGGGPHGGGTVGHRSEIFQAPHWGYEHQEANCADILWDTVVEFDDPLPVQRIEQELPGQHWRPQGSGIEISSSVLDDLERLWRDHSGGQPLEIVERARTGRQGRAGESVIDTKGEVNWARLHPGQCVMGIASEIEVEDGHVLPDSGVLRVFKWKPDEGHLEPRDDDWTPSPARGLHDCAAVGGLADSVASLTEFLTSFRLTHRLARLSRPRGTFGVGEPQLKNNTLVARGIGENAAAVRIAAPCDERAGTPAPSSHCCRCAPASLDSPQWWV